MVDNALIRRERERKAHTYSWFNRGSKVAWHPDRMSHILSRMEAQTHTSPLTQTAHTMITHNQVTGTE